MTRTHAFAVTATGRVRKKNEDAYLADDELGLYAVADGVGGHQWGDVASATAIEATREAASVRLARLLHTPSAKELVAIARHAVEQAAEAVHDIAQPGHPHAGAGTTLTVLLVNADHAAMAHVGDSRLYLVRSGRLERLSTDHTVTNELFRAGYLSADEARHHGFRHVLSRSLGSHRSVLVDTLAIDVRPGDRFLLTTDGVNTAADDPAFICEAVADPDVAAGARRLVARADQLGGRDNATAVLVHIGDSGSVISSRAVDLLAGVSIFAGLDLAARSRVVGAGRTLELEPGAGLDADEPLGGLWMVVDGHLDWCSEPLRPLTRGDWFGETALLTPTKCPVTVVVRDTVRMFHLPADRWARLARRRPALGVAVLGRLGAMRVDGVCHPHRGAELPGPHVVRPRPPTTPPRGPAGPR